MHMFYSCICVPAHGQDTCTAANQWNSNQYIGGDGLDAVSSDRYSGLDEAQSLR